MRVLLFRIHRQAREIFSSLRVLRLKAVVRTRSRSPSSSRRRKALNRIKHVQNNTEKEHADGYFFLFNVYRSRTGGRGGGGKRRQVLFIRSLTRTSVNHFHIHCY